MADVPAAVTDFDRLAGLVERVTFHNEQNGFCVLRLKVKGERELITLIGHAPGKRSTLPSCQPSYTAATVLS